MNTLTARSSTTVAKKSVTLVSMAFAFCFGVAHADDGGGDYLMPAANPTHAPAYKPVTCAESAQAVWFGRQLELSDGDVTPSAVTTRCGSDTFALAKGE